METTHKWITQFNKKCAEFLNFFSIEGTEGLWINIPKNFRKSVEEKEHILQYSMMKFHSDWNWIMEVVEKIEKISDWNLECLNTEERQFQMSIPLSGTYFTSKCKKEAVIQAIDQFIDWYNKQK